MLICDLRLVGVIAEVDEGTEQELVSLAANPQPFPPPVLMEAPDQVQCQKNWMNKIKPRNIWSSRRSVQVQEFQASIAQVTTLFTTYNKVQIGHTF